MKSIKMSLLGGVVAILGNSLVAYAQAVTPAPSTIQTWPQVMIAICTFVGYFFWFIMVLASIMVIVAAYQYITAQDDTEKTSKARRTLTYAAVGIAVALCALAFPMIVGSLITPGSPLKVSCGS
jgi:hypothetical protein